MVFVAIIFSTLPNVSYQTFARSKNVNWELNPRERSVSVYMSELQNHQRHKYCTRIDESLATKRNSKSDTFHTWPKTQMVTNTATNTAHCCLTPVVR